MLFPKYFENANKVKLVRSNLKTELIDAGLSCGGAGLGWLLLFGEAGGGSVSVGATWAAMPLTLASTSAATFECGVSVGRVGNELTGHSDYNQWLDSSPTFSTLILALDVVQVWDVAKTLGANSVFAKFVQNKPSGTFQILKMYKGMTRANRKKLAEEMLKFEYQELAKNQKLLKKVLRGEVLLEDGTKATKVYTQKQVQQLIRTQFYKGFLSRAALKGGAQGVSSVITIKGSGGNIADKAKQSVNFIIGISHRH